MNFFKLQPVLTKLKTLNKLFMEELLISDTTVNGRTVKTTLYLLIALLVSLIFIELQSRFHQISRCKSQSLPSMSSGCKYYIAGDQRNITFINIIECSTCNLKWNCLQKFSIAACPVCYSEVMKSLYSHSQFVGKFGEHCF